MYIIKIRCREITNHLWLEKNGGNTIALVDIVILPMMIRDNLLLLEYTKKYVRQLKIV
jgi:hypothetical protein